MKNISFKLLSVAMVAGLAACGSDGNSTVGPVVAVSSVPTNGTDFALTTAQQMDSYYGPITLATPVTGTSGISIPAGTYSWVTMYQSYILPMANNCGCTVGNTSQYGIGSNLNYSTFNQNLSGYYNNWEYSVVVLNNVHITTTFYPCIDCARAIVDAGIVCLDAPPPAFEDPVWGASFHRSEVILDEGGVVVRIVEDAAGR